MHSFAKKLKVLSTKATSQLNAAKPACDSGIYASCTAQMTEMGKEAMMLEKRAELLSQLSTVELGDIITSKTAIRDNYIRERDVVDKALDVSKSNATARKKAYDEAAKKVGHYETKVSLTKGKSVRNVGKAAGKLEESVKDAVTAHNEYVGALASNNEHIQRYNDILLPHVLESLDALQQFVVKDVKEVLKRMTNAIDFRSDDFLEYQGDLEDIQDKVRRASATTPTPSSVALFLLIANWNVLGVPRGTSSAVHINVCSRYSRHDLFGYRAGGWACRQERVQPAVPGWG